MRILKKRFWILLLILLFLLGGCSFSARDPAEAEPIDRAGVYTAAADVARYLTAYHKLPGNFITKAEARKLGWNGGALDPYAPGKCIGGDRFGNYEELLPQAEGRVYYECDIGTLHAKERGSKRLVYSNDGLIFYTDDHYQTFHRIYGEESS